MIPSHHAASPRVTVVVCTYNRADRLAPCLESLAGQTLAADRFEIVLVDDGSTDPTPEVCARFSARLPSLRVIRQANAGLGAARERGWRAGSAPVVAFLDDDAEAPPNWLETALARFDLNASRPDAPAVLGGPTRGRWEIPRPPWLDDRLAAWLTIWHPVADYRESSDEHLFVGANMFFLRTALEKAGGFDARLGRRGSSLLSHEESELWSRLAAAGFRAAHDPDVWVWHFVPASRCRRRWFLRRVHWEGVSIAMRERPAGDSAHRARALIVTFRALLPPQSPRAQLAWRMNLAFQLGRARVLLRKAPTALAPSPKRVSPERADSGLDAAE